MVALRYQEALLLLYVIVISSVQGQLSAPVAHDSHVNLNNKFLQRQAHNDVRGAIDLEEAGQGACPQNVELKWMTEVSSSVYATPLITDLYSDGRRDIIVPSFVHYTEVLEGGNGAQSVGWPAFHQSSNQASPLLYDIDLDGVRDVLVASADGEVLFFNDEGVKLDAQLTVPRLRVRKYWFKDVKNGDPADHAHPDIGVGGKLAAAAAAAGVSNSKPQPRAATHAAATSGGGVLSEGAKAGGGSSGISSSNAGSGQAGQERHEQRDPLRRRQLLEVDPGAAGGSGIGVAAGQGATAGLSQEAAESFSVFKEVDPGGQADTSAAGTQASEDTAGIATNDPIATAASVAYERTAAEADAEAEADAAASRYDEFGDDVGLAYYQQQHEARQRAAAEAAARGDVAAAAEIGLVDAAADARRGDMGDYGGGGGRGGSSELQRDGWLDEDFLQAKHDFEADEYVFVDAHIECTPAIADIDGDGHEELVLAVSYFYDPEYYVLPEHKDELNGIDGSKYVAGGVVVFDLYTRQLKWSQHLDLTTDNTTYRAYIFASPTLVDLDRDGAMEVVVATALGFVYVLGAADGSPREGWPLQMGEVQGQPLVADLNGDGEVEIFVGDARGSIVLLTAGAKEVWERHLGTAVAASATAGDVNGDGELEIVLGTGDGQIFAVSGIDGSDIDNFPVRTRGRIMSPVLVTRLHDGPSQQLITMSFDGYLYLVDGITGCADTVDVGEVSYSMVLADDLDGDSRLELLVSTMNGNLYCFGTPAAYHPLKAWTSQVLGANGMVARHNYFGIYADQASGAPRDIPGRKLQLKINIMDKRMLVAADGSSRGGRGGPYNVTVLLKEVGAEAMNSGPRPEIGVADTLYSAGSSIMEVPCPRTRTTATIQVELQDAHRLQFIDEFSLSFHMHFHKLLKWFVATPLLGMAGLLLVLKGPQAVATLPLTQLPLRRTGD